MIITLAVLAGCTIVVSRMVNAQLGREIGVYQSTFFNYFIGLLTSLMVLLFIQEQSVKFSLPSDAKQIMMYLGGVIGVSIIVMSNVIATKLPAVHMTLLVFISQIFVGMILDYFLLHEFSPGKLVGGMFVLLGFTFVQYADRKRIA